jgi:hypothetical protein
MDATAPPGNGAAALVKRRREKLTGLPQSNSRSAIVQGFAPQVRCCVVCGVPVENLNLGGHDAPCAFRGALWCLRCADGSPLQ